MRAAAQCLEDKQTACIQTPAVGQKEDGFPACRGFYQAEARGWQDPRQRLQFLVGRRGKNELMPIGGRWEPCDGLHPETDPSSLKATATRTFRAATGLDLAACAEWCA